MKNFRLLMCVCYRETSLFYFHMMRVEDKFVMPSESRSFTWMEFAIVSLVRYVCFAESKKRLRVVIEDQTLLVQEREPDV